MSARQIWPEEIISTLMIFFNWCLPRIVARSFADWFHIDCSRIEQYCADFCSITWADDRFEADLSWFHVLHTCSVCNKSFFAEHFASQSNLLLFSSNYWKNHARSCRCVLIVLLSRHASFLLWTTSTKQLYIIGKRKEWAIIWSKNVQSDTCLSDQKKT